MLKGIDLELGIGRMLCLAGPNGSGKATLLHLMATLLRPQHGTLSVLGHALPSEREAVRGRLGLIAHQAFLYPQLTLRENLQFYATLYRIDAWTSRVSDLADQLDMGAWLDRPVGVLSRGLLQRGAWLRALLPDPELLLLDEPFTGLDMPSTGRLLAMLAHWRTTGKTVVMTSHELHRDLPLCDELVVLGGGRIERHCAASEYS